MSLNITLKTLNSHLGHIMTYKSFSSFCIFIPSIKSITVINPASHMLLKILFGSIIFILINSIFHKYASQAYLTIGTILWIPCWTLKSTQKIDISPVPSFCSASLVYLLASWLLITFPNHSSCLFPVYPLLLTHAFSHSSVKFIPNSRYLTVPLANSSQTR